VESHRDDFFPCARMTTEKNTYCYSCYGLNIRSYFRLPELPEKKFENPDVVIALGQVKDKYTAEHVPEGLHFDAIDCFVFKMNSGTLYQVSGGRFITVQFPDHSRVGFPDIRLYMLSPVFNALLHQRGILLLHAGVLCRNARSIAIAGESGIGKSTIGAELCLGRGYSFVSDDVCAIDDIDGSRIRVLPSVPRLKMLPDTMLRLGLDSRECESIDESKGKFSVPVKDRLATGDVYLEAVFVLSVNDHHHIEVTSLKGVEKVEALLKNLIWIEYLRWMGNQEALFARCNAICSDIEIYRLSFDKRIHSPRLLADEIEKSWNLA